MSTWRLLVATLVLFVIPSCSVFSQPVKATSSSPESNLLVSGKLVRVDEPRSYKGKAVFTEDAHAVVTLAYISGVNGMTGGAGTAGEHDILEVTQRIEGIKGFPIHFRLEGDPEEVFRFPANEYGRGGFYAISAVVHMGSSDKLYVGDFLSEYLEVVYGPTTERDIKMLGQEDCESPNAGGSCLSDKRP